MSEDNKNVSEVGRDETVDTNAGDDAVQGTIADVEVEEPEYRAEKEATSEAAPEQQQQQPKKKSQQT